MERNFLKDVSFDQVTSRNRGLQAAVLERAKDYFRLGLMPFSTYERLVECISLTLRSWCSYFVWDDVDRYVGQMAQAFIQFIRSRYGLGEIKCDEDEDAYLDKITESEYEAFSECLRADVSQELLRQNSRFVGMREFLKMERQNKK